MTIFVVVVFANVGFGALVCVWRAVSCARFRGALRSYAPTVESGCAEVAVGSCVPPSVLDARVRFEERAHDSSGVSTPRSA
jgi:hypothetical protein